VRWVFYILEHTQPTVRRCSVMHEANSKAVWVRTVAPAMLKASYRGRKEMYILRLYGVLVRSVRRGVRQTRLGGTIPLTQLYAQLNVFVSSNI